MVKRVFSMLLGGLQGLINLVFNLLNCRCYALTIHELVRDPKWLTSCSIQRLKEPSST
nr:hypothetical protein [Candidatus Enterovibrio luxaltus]